MLTRQSSRCPSLLRGPSREERARKVHLRKRCFLLALARTRHGMHRRPPHERKLRGVEQVPVPVGQGRGAGGGARVPGLALCKLLLHVLGELQPVEGAEALEGDAPRVVGVDQVEDYFARLGGVVLPVLVAKGFELPDGDLLALDLVQVEPLELEPLVQLVVLGLELMPQEKFTNAPQHLLPPRLRKIRVEHSRLSPSPTLSSSGPCSCLSPRVSALCCPSQSASLGPRISLCLCAGELCSLARVPVPPRPLPKHTSLGARPRGAWRAKWSRPGGATHTQRRGAL
mmetsp:Transcript_9723/g.18899  ORF Transcript_9723/g.18899 Transcript_9723/m.18899 type:complete len:285 (-) Transcript_9723:33-887(-)